MSQPVQPNPTAPQGGATLNVTATKPLLAWMLIFFPPRLNLNGQEIRLKWGENQIPVAPGNYQAAFHVPYLWPIGRAALAFQAGPGQAVPIYYASPWFVFQEGAVGHQPVDNPGKVAGIVLMAVVPALIILFCCISLIANGLSSSY